MNTKVSTWFANLWRSLVPPPKTKRMRTVGLKWARVRGEERWVMVCDTCGSNCGQCGLTALLGNFEDDAEIAFRNIVKSVSR